MFHKPNNILSQVRFCVNFCLRFHRITLYLKLNPLFLEVGEGIIPIELPLLRVEGVDDHLNEQVCDEKWTEDHVDDED